MEKKISFLLMTCALVSLFLFKQLETLARLPLLVWKLAGGGIKKVMVVDYRLFLLMQRIVGCRPKEVG
jgi:hypothetical protein